MTTSRKPKPARTSKTPRTPGATNHLALVVRASRLYRLLGDLGDTLDAATPNVQRARDLLVEIENSADVTIGTALGAAGFDLVMERAKSLRKSAA